MSAVGIAEDLTRSLVERGEPWWVDARCRELSGDVAGTFFSERPRDIARAKRICAACPVMTPCLGRAPPA